MFEIEFNRPIIANAKLQRYRIILTPHNQPEPTPSNVTDISFKNYIEKDLEKDEKNNNANNDPERIKIKLPVNDYKGNKINQYQKGKYQIHLLTIYQDTASPNSPASTSFEKLGDIEMFSKGTEYKFIVNPSIEDGKYIRILPSVIDKYRIISSSQTEITRNAEANYDCLSRKALRFLMNRLIIYPGVAAGIKDLALKDDMTRTLSVLFERRSDIIEKIQLGTISFKNLETELDTNKCEARKSNIRTSVEQLNALLEFSKEVNTSFDSDSLYATLNCIRAFIDNLSKTEKQLESVVNSISELQSAYIENFTLLEANPTSFGSTTMLDFVSEGKLRIVPDFGFIGVFKGDGSLNLHDFTPYLGFHINFRPIDKHIPLRLVRYKSWRHRFSFLSGITLRSLKIENKREDFFGNSSLITGLGFRLNNYVKLTGGTVWFKTTDINPLSTNKPVRSSAFFGISLDLEVQELFGGIKNLFKL